MPSIIQSFTGKYAFLSPLFRSAFFFDNDQYNSPAAAFEAAKILSRPDRVSFIGWNMQPWNARRLGKNIPKNWMRPDWDAAQFDIMLEIQRSKFSWLILREMLLDTEDAQLVHGNACHDNFWGVCLCQSLPPASRSTVSTLAAPETAATGSGSSSCRCAKSATPVATALL